MSENWQKVVLGVVQGVILAATLWTATYATRLEYRMLRVEFALGIEKLPNLERNTSNGQR